MWCASATGGVRARSPHNAQHCNWASGSKPTQSYIRHDFCMLICLVRVATYVTFPVVCVLIRPGLLPPFFHPRIKLRARIAHGGGRRPGNEAKIIQVSSYIDLKHSNTGGSYCGATPSKACSQAIPQVL